MTAEVQTPRGNRSCIVIVILFIVGAGLVAYDIDQRIRNAYAVWWVAGMVIEHLKANDDHWPGSWDDLRDDYDTCVQQSGQPWQCEDLRGRVTVDFKTDTTVLKAHVEANENAQLRVIWLSNGSDVHWQSRDPNRLVADYLKRADAKVEPVTTGHGGS